jgi:hypothetical protein
MAPIVTLATYNPDDVKPGWIAFWIVVALGVATFLLWRNMNSQLRKIKAPYRDELRADGTAPTSRTADDASDGTADDSAGDSSSASGPA